MWLLHPFRHVSPCDPMQLQGKLTEAARFASATLQSMQILAGAKVGSVEVRGTRVWRQGARGHGERI